MSDFLLNTYYGNTVSEWLIALLIIAGAFIVAKITYWLFKGVFKQLTQKTKSKLDDLIVDKIEEPVVLAIVIAGFWYGVAYLNMSENWSLFWDKVFYVAITFDVSWMIVRLVDAIILEYLSPIVKKSKKGNFDSQILPIIRKSIKTVIWIIAIVVGLNNAGYDVGALVAGLGLGGLAFAMAAKDSVANIFGGVTVFADKPFKVGDRIQISGFDGNVVSIGIRSTRLKTLAGRIVTIPNKVFTDEFIENVSSEPNRKVTLNLGLTYDTTPDRIQKGIDLLKEIAKANTSLEDNHVAIFNGFGDFSLNLLFVFFIKAGEDNYQISNDINMEVLKKFNEEKLDFAFPTQTIITEKA